MKKFLITVLAFTTLLSFSTTVQARRTRSQQEGHVVKLIDLPDVPYFKTNYGYMDIGATFTSTKIFGVPLWNSGVKYCGYVGSDKTYIFMNPGIIASRVASYNKEAKKQGWEPIDMAKVQDNRDAWHAVIKMYNNQMKAASKGKFTPLKIELPAKPKLPFWYRLGGKLLGGAILLIILVSGGIGALFKKKKKSKKEKKEETTV